MTLIDTEKKGYYRQTTSQMYLLDAAEMRDGETVYLRDSNMTRLQLTDMQAALDVQYGKNKYKAHSHGSARYVTREF